MIDGHFRADFASFYDACTKAEVSLKDIKSGSEKVETSLTTMSNSLSGTKIIQQATIMAEAVERVGGVSMLTEKELARVGGTAQEAANKLRAMGQDVPPGIQNIATAARDADTAHKGLGSTVKDVVIGFAAMFTARAAFDFVKVIVNDASALKDLGQQTHINVEELQLLAGGMSEFGVDAETLGKGLYKLSRGIAGGDESVARGLHMMGMSLKDVEGLNGKELFLKIESGLATLQGGLRDTAAAELYGGKLGAAMAGASEGIEGALEKWQQLNHVASTESVDSLDSFGEAIARANKNLMSMATNMAGPVAQGFNTVNDAVDRGASKWAIAWAMAKDLDAATFHWGSGTENLATLLDHLNVKIDAETAGAEKNAGAHTKVVVALSAHEQAVRFMAQLENDASATLDSWQLKSLAHLKEIGALTAANAAAIGVNAGQFAKYEAGIASAKEYAEWLARNTKAEGDMWREAAAANRRFLEGMTATVQKEMATQRGLVQAAQMDIIGILTAGKDKLVAMSGQAATGMDAQLEALTKHRAADLADLQQKGRAAMDLGADWNDKLTEGANQIEEIFQREWNDIVTGANTGMSAVAAAVGDPGTKGAAKAAAGAIRSEFVTAFQDVGSAADAAAARVSRVLQLASDNAANMKGNPSMGANFGTASSINRIAASAAGLTIPQFAEGGSGDFGTGTLVMLHGKETITKDGMGGARGGVVVNANININVGAGGDAKQAGRDAADALLARMKQRGARV